MAHVLRLLYSRGVASSRTRGNGSHEIYSTEANTVGRSGPRLSRGILGLGQPTTISPTTHTTPAHPRHAMPRNQRLTTQRIASLRHHHPNLICTLCSYPVDGHDPAHIWLFSITINLLPHRNSTKSFIITAKHIRPFLGTVRHYNIHASRRGTSLQN